MINDFLYKSGDLFLSGRLKKYLDYYYIGDDNSLFYLTNWSINHFLSGFIIGYFLIFILHIYNSKTIYFYGFVIHSIWELWQIFIKNTKLNLRGIIDVIVDTLCSMIGLYVYVKLLELYNNKN